VADDIELDIGPTGTIRTIYKDERLGFFKQLGTTTIRRASLVEWERGEEEGVEGWTVRAAHDRGLAIRAILDRGMYRRIVSREGELLHFITREAALEAEQDHFWELIPRRHNT
jgi:hypothetical protein